MILIYGVMSCLAMYASRYEVPQQQVLKEPLYNQKIISPEGNSHADGAYAALNIPEGHHIYGPGNVQEPVYNGLQDPKIMFQNYGCGFDQPVYYALEDLSIKDSVESLNTGPTEPEPVYNVLEDPEVMFQNYGSGIDQPVYYAQEDLSVKDSAQSFNNGPNDPESVFNGSGINQPMYYALEDLSVKHSAESVHNGPTEQEPVYNVLDQSYTEGSEEPGCHGAITVDGPVYNTLEQPYPYPGYPCKNEPAYIVLEAPGYDGSSFQDPGYNVLEGP